MLNIYKVRNSFEFKRKKRIKSVLFGSFGFSSDVSLGSNVGFVEVYKLFKSELSQTFSLESFSDDLIIQL